MLLPHACCSLQGLAEAAGGAFNRAYSARYSASIARWSWMKKIADQQGGFPGGAGTERTYSDKPHCTFPVVRQRRVRAGGGLFARCKHPSVPLFSAAASYHGGVRRDTGAREFPRAATQLRCERVAADHGATEGHERLQDLRAVSAVEPYLAEWMRSAERAFDNPTHLAQAVSMRRAALSTVRFHAFHIASAAGGLAIALCPPTGGWFTTALTGAGRNHNTIPCMGSVRRSQASKRFGMFLPDRP
jgi:hypothetical protein